MTSENKRVYIFDINFLYQNEDDPHPRSVCKHAAAYATDKDSASKKIAVIADKWREDKWGENAIVKGLSFGCELSLEVYKETGLNESLGDLG